MHSGKYFNVEGDVSTTFGSIGQVYRLMKWLANLRKKSEFALAIENAKDQFPIGATDWHSTCKD